MLDRRLPRRLRCLAAYTPEPNLDEELWAAKEARLGSQCPEDVAELPLRVTRESSRVERSRHLRRGFMLDALLLRRIGASDHMRRQRINSFRLVQGYAETIDILGLPVSPWVGFESRYEAKMELAPMSRRDKAMPAESGSSGARLAPHPCEHEHRPAPRSSDSCDGGRGWLIFSQAR